MLDAPVVGLLAGLPVGPHLARDAGRGDAGRRGRVRAALRAGLLGLGGAQGVVPRRAVERRGLGHVRVVEGREGPDEDAVRGLEEPRRGLVALVVLLLLGHLDRPAQVLEQLDQPLSELAQAVTLAAGLLGRLLVARARLLGGLDRLAQARLMDGRRLVPVRMVGGPVVVVRPLLRDDALADVRGVVRRQIVSLGRGAVVTVEQARRLGAVAVELGAVLGEPFLARLERPVALVECGGASGVRLLDPLALGALGGVVALKPLVLRAQALVLGDEALGAERRVTVLRLVALTRVEVAHAPCLHGLPLGGLNLRLSGVADHLRLGFGGGDALLVGPLVRSAKLVQLHVLAVAALAVEPDAVAVLGEPLVHGVLEDAAHLGGVGRDARAPALVLLVGLGARLALPLRLNHLARGMRLLDVHVLERRVHVHRPVVREDGVNLVDVRALVEVQVDGDGLDARLGAVRGGARVEACLPLVDGLEPRAERGRRVERGLDVPDLQNRLVHLVALHVAELVEGLPAARVALPAVGMNGALVLGAEMRLVPLARRLDGYSDLTPAGQLGAVRVDVDVAATALLELVVILTVEAAVVVRERVTAALRVDARLHLLAHVVASLIRVGC